MTPLAAYSPLRVKASNWQADWGLACLVLSPEGDESYFFVGSPARVAAILLSAGLVSLDEGPSVSCLAGLADVLGSG